MPAGVAHFLNWIYSSANAFVGAQGKLFWELLALFFLRYRQRARILLKVNKNNNNKKTKKHDGQYPKKVLLNESIHVCPVYTAVLNS